MAVPMFSLTRVMIILCLLAILIGSFATSLALWLSGASWGVIALGYLAGGWAGLGLGAVTVMLACRLPRSGQKPGR